VNDSNRLSALAEAACAGDPLAYEALVRVLWPNAYRIAWSILGDREAAQDAAQSACASICRNLPTLVERKAFVAWAYRIIIRRANDSARARSRLRKYETLGYDAVVNNAANVRSSHDDPTLRLDLAAAIGALPDALRLALELHYFVGLSSRETGIALGIPAATVRFRLMLARRRLRPLLCDSTAPSVAPEVLL
jgi:RNA polymerase sigma-70 factor (ECF subfamily)